MNKTLDDYMNDPDIINEPMPLRKIHAIRLMIYDEIKDMTPEERTAYYNEGARSTFSKLGIVPKYTTPYRDNS
ncbi:MAG: hypothetical protein FWF38_05125 [Spirochaetaceae bacterium]|nr:hypothetical protein [Spirochaetaceae bacterium]